MLYNNEKAIIINAPAMTGNKIKPNDLAPITAIIGFPPAGGWIVFVVIITKIANPTARPIVKGLVPKIKYTNTPDKADNVCPKKIFFGWASGLVWADITKTIDAPKGGINHKFVVSEKLK